MRHPAVILAAALVSAAASAAPPEWTAGGVSSRYPDATHLTGFAVGAASKGLPAVKAEAAAALAQRITLRIESQTMVSESETDGRGSSSVAVLTRASSDVRLSHLAFETHEAGGRLFALAVLARTPAAGSRRQERDAAAARARDLLEAGNRREKEKEESSALRDYLAARVAVAEAAGHEAVARALLPVTDDGALTRLMQLDSDAEARIRRLLGKAATSIANAAEQLAFQLHQQGLSRAANWSALAPFTYGSTTYSSVFGRQVAQELERALASAPQVVSETEVSGDVAVRGVYADAGGEVRLLVVVREARSGRAVASAQARLPREAVPPELSFLPLNFQQALEEQRVLAAGEEVSGDLRVELWTTKGRSGLVYSAGEEMRLYTRVNRPAWLRITYLLANGLKVPLTQAHYVDASKVNLAVEYPDTFEIAPPYGIERIHVTAFTEKPEPLPTRRVVVEGEDYEVIADGLEGVVRHRGVKVKKAAAQIAETFVELTTLPSPSR